MRTINATLSAAMTSGDGIPVTKYTIKRYNNIGVLQETLTGNVTKYEWNNLTLKLECPSFTWTPSHTSYTTLKIDRGLQIGGVEYTDPTPTFYLRHIQSDPWGTSQLFCHMLPALRVLNISGAQDAEDAITAYFNALIPPQTLLASPHTSDSWRLWDFYPTGNINLPFAENLIDTLIAKYLVGVYARVGGLMITWPYFTTAYAFTPHSHATITTFKIDDRTTNYSIAWTDELNIKHLDLVSGAPVHNCGFIPSTVTDFPDEAATRIKPILIIEQRPNLSIENGDTISYNSETFPISFVEKFNKSTSPNWQQIITDNPLIPFSGGSPQTGNQNRVEGQQQIITDNFNNLLSSNDSTVQTALETLDEAILKRGKTSAPTVNDDSGDGYIIGDIWVNETADDAYMALDVTAGAAVWKKITP